MTAADVMLTEREWGIVDLVCQGFAGKEIAESLDMRYANVKRRLQVIYLKAGIYEGSKRVQLVKMFAKLPAPADDTRVKLTPREIEAVILVADGKQNKAIAEEMGVAGEQSVKNNLRIIFDKCGVWTRSELTLWWLAHKHQYEQ